MKEQRKQPSGPLARMTEPGTPVGEMLATSAANAAAAQAAAAQATAAQAAAAQAAAAQAAAAAATASKGEAPAKEKGEETDEMEEPVP